MRIKPTVLLCLGLTTWLTSPAVADSQAPSLRITGGNGTEDRWLGTDIGFAYEASDASGIRRVELHADGQVAGYHPAACERDPSVPCSDLSSTVQILTELEDGAHQVFVRAVDGAGNYSDAGHRTIRTDTSSPEKPLAFGLDARGGWRPTNGFDFTWRDPEQRFAPITGVSYELCPAEVAPESGRCRYQHHLRTPIRGSLTDLRVPGQGRWRFRMWLVDEAGNDRYDFASDPVEFGLDSGAPSLTFGDRPPSNPTAIPLLTGDAVSGVDVAEVEMRKVGTTAWTPLKVERSGDGFVGRLADEDAPDGIYELRARVRDRAGNERSSDVLANAQPARVQLPVRARTRLVGGRRRGVGRRGRLSSRPVVRAGATARLTGRLTLEGGNAIAGVPIEVFEQVDVPGQGERPIGAVTTSRTGRFVFKVAKGPRRLVTFRYRGQPTVRSATAKVRLRVKARTTLRASRRAVVNGEDVTFRGRLAGRPWSGPSKLVKLQVFSRDEWLTFATPRADPTSGLWSHRYRFAATRGSVRYRFRAVVPLEGGYPYDSGGSRQVRVRVRGL